MTEQEFDSLYPGAVVRRVGKEEPFRVVKIGDVPHVVIGKKFLALTLWNLKEFELIPDQEFENSTIWTLVTKRISRTLTPQEFLDQMRTSGAPND